MRFLFCPMGSHGFVYPAIQLALGLRQRGHEVAFATSETFQPLFEQVGLVRLPRDAADGPSFVIDRWAHPVEAALQYKHLEYALRHFSADVLVGTPFSLGAYLMRERVGIPLAVLGMASHLWPSSGEAPPAQPSVMERWQWWRYEDMLRHLNRARELLRAPPVSPPPRELPFLGDLFLLRSVPELAGPEADYPERVHLVGDCLWDPPTVDPALEAWLEQTGGGSNADVLYVQHGRSFDGPTFWPQLMEALADKPLRLVASTSRMEHKPSSLPARCYARDFLPQKQVLPHAAGLIASATTTAVLGALTQGVPCLLIPGGGEQPDLAALVARSGAGLSIPSSEASAEVLSRAVDRLLNDQGLRDQAQRLQRAFARMDSPARALELLETLGHTRGPVPRARAAK
jgi:UDP:flavonoid glycosyltransferase YjiC (YdhE family)